MADPYEYEALHDIYIGGDTPGSLPVAAFRAGDGVPASHVKDHGLKVGEDVKSRKGSARTQAEQEKKAEQELKKAD